MGRRLIFAMCSLVIVLTMIFVSADQSFAEPYIDRFVGQVQERVVVYGIAQYEGKTFILSKEDRVMIERDNKKYKAFLTGIFIWPLDRDRGCVIPIVKQEIAFPDIAIFIIMDQVEEPINPCL